MKPRHRFRYVNDITGTFVLIAVFLVVGGIILSSRTQQMFTTKYRFGVVLPKEGTFGLRDGGRVFLLGIDVGSVERIDVDEQGAVRAQVAIRSDFQRFVRTDSVARIKKAFGLAGDSSVEISKGKKDDLPPENRQIACVSSEELPDVVSQLISELRRELLPVIGKAGQTLDNWSLLAQELGDTQSQLRVVAGRLDAIVDHVQQGQGVAGKLLMAETSADEVERLLRESRELLARGNVSVDQLQKIILNLDKGIARLPEITDDLAREGRDLPGTVRQAQQTLREIERLVQGLERHWLVRKYIPAAPEAMGDDPKSTASKKLPPAKEAQPR